MDTLTHFSMECTTIDSSPHEEQKPNTAPMLVAARQHWPDHMDHANVLQCISNLVECVRSKQSFDMPGDARIVGHGNCGFIVTGTGQGGDHGPDHILTEWNYYAYHEAMQELQPSSLQLWGCKVGAGFDGASFLWLLAKTIKCPVTAPTGFVFGDGSVQPGCRWQIGQPHSSSAEPELPPLPDPPHLMKLVDVIASRGTERLTFALSTNDTLRGLFDRLGNSYSFEGSGLTRALNLLEVGRPFKTLAGSAATVTGHLLIETGENEPRTTLTVYCDSIICDLARPDYYMYLSKTARRFLTDLRISLGGFGGVGHCG